MSLKSQKSFLFLRHGETIANAADIIAGSMDSPLTENGYAQAETAAQILAKHEIASIWCSPLSRARETAEATQRLTQAPLFELAGLAERDWGAWEGEPRTILRRDETPPNGEGPLEFRARIWEALDQITGPFPVLIVAHSGTAREIHAALSPEPFERLGNAVPIEWRQENGHWNCTKLS